MPEVKFILLDDGATFSTTPKCINVGKDIYAYRYIADSFAHHEKRSMQLPHKSPYYVRGGASEGNIFCTVFEGCAERGGKKVGEIVIALNVQQGKHNWKDLQTFYVSRKWTMPNDAPAVPWCAISIEKEILSRKMQNDSVRELLIHYAICLTWAWMEHCATTAPKKG